MKTKQNRIEFYQQLINYNESDDNHFIENDEIRNFINRAFLFNKVYKIMQNAHAAHFDREKCPEICLWEMDKFITEVKREFNKKNDCNLNAPEICHFIIARYKGYFDKKEDFKHIVEIELLMEGDFCWHVFGGR